MRMVLHRRGSSCRCAVIFVRLLKAFFCDACRMTCAGVLCGLAVLDVCKNNSALILSRQTHSQIGVAFKKSESSMQRSTCYLPHNTVLCVDLNIHVYHCRHAALQPHWSQFWGMVHPGKSFRLSSSFHCTMLLSQQWCIFFTQMI